MFSLKMLFETTYNERKVETSIDNAVGPKFSLWTRIKMGGNGCRRMTVEETSPLIWSKIKNHPGIHYSSIELRPKGIIVYFKNNLRLFSWVVPYYQLAIYKSKNFSLHSQGQFVKYKLDDAYNANQKFFNKMMENRNNQRAGFK